MFSYGGRKPQPRKLTRSQLLQSLETEETTPTRFVSTRAATEPQTRVVHKECWTTPPTRQPHSVRPTATPTPRRVVIVAERPYRPDRTALEIVDAMISKMNRVSIY